MTLKVEKLVAGAAVLVPGLRFPVRMQPKQDFGWMCAEPALR